jgi:hypothetical protein
MDLLERGIFSKYTGFQREKIPEISQLVNGYRSHSNYESFIRMISRPEYAHFLKPGRLQDCWKIVNLVQDLMIENGYSK